MSKITITSRIETERHLEGELEFRHPEETAPYGLFLLWHLQWASRYRSPGDLSQHLTELCEKIGNDLYIRLIQTG